MISAVVLTHNEEKNIQSCLSTIKWCDEIIVVDDESTDKTSDIARKFGATVFIRALNGNFSEQRNFGLTKAKGDWIFFVDADERVSEALWFEIMQHTNSLISNYSGFFLKRRDVIWGHELAYGETGNIKLLRLAKKDAGEWEGAVHEVWKINGNTASLNNPLMHYPHVNVEKFLREINFYTNLRAKELYSKKKKTAWVSILFYPSVKFVQNYILKLGFRDGVPGLLLALMMSFHSFLVRSKLWILCGKK